MNELEIGSTSVVQAPHAAYHKRYGHSYLFYVTNKPVLGDKKLSASQRRSLKISGSWKMTRISLGNAGIEISFNLGR